MRTRRRDGRPRTWLTASALCVAGASAAAVAVAGDEEEGTDQDVWDVAQGVVVTAHSGTLPASSIRDMFGASESAVESTATLFRDDEPEGFVHFVEWRTPAPVSVDGFTLRANDDYNAQGDRGFSEFRLYARNTSTDEFDLVYSYSVPRNPYGEHITVTDLFDEVVAQEFRAEFVQAAPAGRPGGPRIQELDAPTPAVSVDGYLLPLKAALKSNSRTPSKSRLIAAGLLDTGATAPAFGTALTLAAGGLQAMSSGLTPVKSSFRLDEQGFLLTVTPSRFGSSRGKFKLAFVGDPGANVDPDGALALSYADTAVSLTGTPVLDRGKFALKRGGELLGPRFTLVRAKAKLVGAGKDSYSVVAAIVRDDTAPTSEFSVRLSFGDAVQATFPPDAFVRHGEVFTLRAPTAAVKSAKLDFRTGLVSFSGKGVDLGAIPEGPSAVRVALSFGADRREVSVRMVRTGTKFRY